MTEEELKNKAKESYWDSEASGSMSSKNCYVIGYIAGAKEMIEKMKCCPSCQSFKLNNVNNCYTCDGNYSNWELAE